MPLELRVHDIDPRGRRILDDERDVDAARARRIGDVPELMIEVPRQGEMRRRVEFQHLAPLAFRAVGAALVVATALTRLEDRLEGLDLADVVRPRPPRIELRRKY